MALTTPLVDVDATAGVSHECPIQFVERRATMEYPPVLAGAVSQAVLHCERVALFER